MLANGIKFFIDRTKPENDKTEWRFHYDLCRKAYDEYLQVLKPDFIYNGPVYIIMSENTIMEYDIKDFSKVFPNFNAEKDLIIKI